MRDSLLGLGCSSCSSLQQQQAKSSSIHRNLRARFLTTNLISQPRSTVIRGFVRIRGHPDVRHVKQAEQSVRALLSPARRQDSDLPLSPLRLISAVGRTHLRHTSHTFRESPWRYTHPPPLAEDKQFPPVPIDKSSPVTPITVG
jgi:hypothetical protein